MADPRKESFDEENSARQDDKSLLGHDMRSDFHHNQKTGGRGVVVTLLSLAVFINLMWSASLMLATVHQRPDRATTEAPKPEWLDLIYSPAKEAVKYEVVETNTTIDSTNIYMGKPRPEQTLAWEEITKWRNIAVSKEDLDVINQTSIELADGSGYMATLEVFHHVHCLDFIRMYIFRDYYDTHETEQLRWQHVDHCIEVLREAVMCQGDISLVTWQWVDRQQLPFANFNVKHECRNWDSILEWTKQHQAAPESIVRPSDKPWPPHKHDT